MAIKKPNTVYTESDGVSSAIARKRAEDIAYMSAYTKNFLQKLKNEPKRKIFCSKAYAPYFGTTYTALLNTVPVTVKFNGTEQEFPESVANWLQDKFLRVTESNVPKVENETLSE
jgi:hypothetical protein